MPSLQTVPVVSASLAESFGQRKSQENLSSHLFDPAAHQRDVEFPPRWIGIDLLQNVMPLHPTQLIDQQIGCKVGRWLKIS